MIVVRNTFRIKFGRMKEAVSQLKEGQAILKSAFQYPMRALTDVTGPNYTLSLETTHENLAEFEKSLRESTQQSAWQAWYRKFVDLAESGHREIYSVIE